MRYSYFVSLKYAPGLWKEFHLLGERLRAQGSDVRYLLSANYTWMAEEFASNPVLLTRSTNLKETLIDFLFKRRRVAERCGKCFAQAPPAFICFYNYHPFNVMVARCARQAAPNGLRVVFVHEPAKTGKAAYGLKGRLFFQLLELGQRQLIRLSTDVIVPSPYARQLFREHFPQYAGRVHYAPLLTEDRHPTASLTRRYFSMVGRFNFTKRLNTFIAAINLAAEKNQTLEFQIVTASDISAELQRLSPRARSTVKIVNNTSITDADISNALAESLGVLCLHPNVTQSGVMPVAFMNSTPVIVRDEPGFTQFVRHGDNGWVLPKGFTPGDLVAAMEDVRCQFQTLSVGARETYETVFDANTWPTYYSWIARKLVRADAGLSVIEVKP